MESCPSRISIFIMKIQDYINSKLEELNKEDRVKRISAKDELKAEIFRLLMSKKFRKYAVNIEYLEHIRQAISTSVDKDEPVKLTLVLVVINYGDLRKHQRLIGLSCLVLSIMLIG